LGEGISLPVTEKLNLGIGQEALEFRALWVGNYFEESSWINSYFTRGISFILANVPGTRAKSGSRTPAGFLFGALRW